ncbi:hypothetical protein BAUCODRAFT_23622 [Baudoinia panamericana UAMH 10762]|uniref:Uncharacterized protein n=1 Tax=Baudoinia panamericana (strain UAMH 10762) TaxID=717646 RepID=M2NDK0_BAUPA|nr:uncharacterized protein BAUCODRAFT_23622 [Baudoinia panamericana UAMH 10762]EMC97299.1 hypothetical protein BAUCODRAFT_23622 [Baudoinia panamericana UAMH 10762]
MAMHLQRTKTLWPRPQEEGTGAAQVLVPPPDTTLFTGELGATAQSSGNLPTANFEERNSQLNIPLPHTKLRDSSVLGPSSLKRRAAVLQVGVPTARTLSHNVVIVKKRVWDLYQPIDYPVNQGHKVHTSMFLCRRKNSSSDTDKLYVIQEQKSFETGRLLHFSKPKSQYLVELYGAFTMHGTLWTIYEEMDLSLEQVLGLRCGPWTIHPERKHNQIGSIAYQASDSPALS